MRGDVTLTFHVANSIDEAKTSSLYVEMDEHLGTSLFQSRAHMPREIDLLVSLDPHNHRVLGREEVSILMHLSDWLRTSAQSSELRDFGERLWWLCKNALAFKKSVVVLGD